MATIGPNGRFHGLLDQSPPGAMRELEQRRAEVERTHRGRPLAEVEAALASAIAGAGLEPDPVQVAEQARRISSLQSGA